MSPLDPSHSVTVTATTSLADSSNKDAEYCSDGVSTPAHAQLPSLSNNHETVSISHRCGSHESMNGGQGCDIQRSNDFVLFEFTFRQIMLLILGAPFCALISSFVIGFSTDRDVLLNYEWTCGVSISHQFWLNEEQFELLPTTGVMTLNIPV